jgi:DNA primase
MEIAEIKQKLTLAHVLHHYGLKPDKSLRLNCPFHEDKTPSLQVYYKTHTAYCFSANCQTHGKSLDVIDFIMYMEAKNGSFSAGNSVAAKHHALLKCMEILGISEAKKSAQSLKPINQGSDNLPSIEREPFLQNMFTYFKNAVHNSKPARDYIAQRGLDFTRLEIGYNTGQFHHGSRRDEQLIKSCIKVGLLSPFGTNNRSGGQAYKAFGRECICFALKNRANQITGLYFRNTLSRDEESKLPAGAPRHYYLKDSTGLYPNYPDPETQQLIITESIIDAASLLQLETITKTYAILAAYGTNRLTPEHIKAIKELKNLSEIVFAFDNDEAGNTATAKYAKQLQELLPQRTISKLELPENEDINSTAQAHNEEIFTHLLENRIVLFSTEKETSESTSPNSELPSPNSINTKNPFKISYRTETATYYIQGGVGKTLDSMKVTLVIEHPETSYKTRNKLDLYEDKQVEKICKEVAERLNIRRDLLEADLYKLTDLLDEYRDQRVPEDNQGILEQDQVYPLTALERQQAEEFLKKEHVIKRLNELLGKAGITGEENSRIFLLLIAISYKMPETLHALIQGSSGSGKTRLLKQISDCIPKDKVTKLTRVSDKVLYNYPEKYFINRLLCLEDIDGLSEEAEFAFRELQSNGELNSATSSKLENGQIVAGQRTVKGPIASLACTTKGEIYEDNMSRCFLVAVDESAEQTERVLTYQNRKAEGITDLGKEQEVKRFIQNLVSVLQALQVVNPYASKVQLPREAHKIRRLNELFQSFVKQITLLNQYQRKKDSKGRLIVEIQDLEEAIGIMFESIVLKVDELDGSLRQFYERLKEYLRKNHSGNYKQAEFTQRDIRHELHVSKAQIHRYLTSLMELEYIQMHGGYANKGFKFKILFWDDYKALRDRIKKNLEGQIKELRH